MSALTKPIAKRIQKVPKVPKNPAAGAKTSKSSGSSAAGTNLNPVLGAIVGTPPGASASPGPATNSGTPGRTVLVGDQFQLLTKLEAEAVAKWATKVKNLQSTGATNTALSMIADELHRDLDQKIQVLEKDTVKATAWRTWSCKDLISFLERAYPHTGTHHETVEDLVKATVKFGTYRADQVASMDRIQSSLNSVIHKYPSVLLDQPGNKSVTALLYRSLKNQHAALHESMSKGGW